MNQSATSSAAMFTMTDKIHSGVHGMNEISANVIAAKGV